MLCFLLHDPTYTHNYEYNRTVFYLINTAPDQPGSSNQTCCTQVSFRQQNRQRLIVLDCKFSGQLKLDLQAQRQTVRSFCTMKWLILAILILWSAYFAFNYCSEKTSTRLEFYRIIIMQLLDGKKADVLSFNQSR